MAKHIDDIKLRYLHAELQKEEISKPTRGDVTRIIEVGYVQAGNYLKAMRKS